MQHLGQPIALGLALGFGAGIAPGPLLGLIISASLRGGFRSGLRIACVPLLSDLPMLVLSLTVVAALPHKALSVLAVGGGVLLCFLGVQTVREARTASLHDSTLDREGNRRMLRQAIAVNWLNPHPWLFWVGVGGPLLVSAWRSAPLGGAAFLASFYALIVGTKVVLAWLVALSRGRLDPTWYRRAVIGSGLLLVVAGGLLVVEFASQIG
jgi:threonine/homoserine/homoserine lactone efflux protein